MRLINMIPKLPKKEGVILIGRGPSVDNLHMEMINRQTRYDTCTITDAIKLLENPTYSFNYHDQGFVRIKAHIHKPKYLIMPVKIINDIDKKHNWDISGHDLTELPNTYFFEGRNRKNMDVFTQGLFDIEVTDKLFNRHGSVVGALHFLLGYMRYEKIFYIGFDGGTTYGKIVHGNRKQSKIEGAAKDYEKSWNTALEMIKHYPVQFKPLTQFLLKGNKPQ